MENTTTEKKLSYEDCKRCFVSKERQTIIDVLHPETGRTLFYGKTLEDVQKEYSDAEEMSINDFCTWKAQMQRSVITWNETTEEHFNSMLDALPPAAMDRTCRAFLMGEPYDHDALNGQPRYDAFRKIGKRYEKSSRPMTRAEFWEEMRNHMNFLV